jgi:hypothetical protein
MRYTRIALVLLSFGVCNLTDAQWLPANATTGPIYYNGGDTGIVGIGTSTPTLHNGNSPGLVMFGSYPAIRFWATGAGARGYQLSTGSIGQFTIIDSAAGTSRFMIDATGKVGVGTSAPTSRLHVLDSTTVAADATQNDFGFTVTANQSTAAGVTNSGRVAGVHIETRNTGTGTVAQAIGSRVQSGVADNGTGIVNQAYGYRAQILKANGTVHYGYGVAVHDIQATNDYAFYQDAADDSNYFAGDIVIGAVGATGTKLAVNGSASVSGNLVVNGNFTSPTAGSFGVGGTAPAGFPFFATNSTALVPAAIQLHSNYANQATSYMGNFGNYGTYLTHNRNPYTGAFTDAAASPNQANAAQLALGDTMPGRNRLFTLSNYPGGTETIRMLVKWNGNVGVGAGVETLMDQKPDKEFVVNGDIEISGNINAKYQDIAEWVPSSNDLSPGTVVVLDAALGNGVKASMTAYDTKVAGVVSAQPGITLGESGASKEQVATTGRVRVKVDATHAPIAVGDILVTSDKPGYAMKSVPVDVAGIAFHRPGTIVGKALEALASGEGELLVLLSLQ